MAGIERIFDIQGYSGGESDDVTRGPKDSFYQGENIEVRKDLAGTQLSCKLTDTGWSISGDIILMQDLAELGVASGGIVVCTETGNVYLNGTLKFTLNTGTNAFNRVIGIGVNTTLGGTQYVYMVTQATGGTGKIHKVDTALSSGSLDTAFKDYTGTAGSGDKAYCITSNKNLYIAVGYKVMELTNQEILSDKLVLDINEKITGFSEFQNSFKIYANRQNTGIQYVWDGSSIQYDYRQEWKNQPILGIVNDGAFDYAVLGYSDIYSDLYLISGTQKQELRVNLEASSTSRTLDGYLSIREGIVYISGGLSGESSNYGIYTYGNYYPGTPKSLVQQYSLGTNKYLFHAHTTTTSYFANNDDKVYKIEHNNPPSTLGYADSGYVVSNIYEGNVWEEKNFNRMKVGFKTNGGSIKIYIRKELGDSWQLIKTIDNTTYQNKRGLTIYQNEMKSINFGSYYTLQIKAELLPGVADGINKYSPSIKRITTFMDVIKE